MTSKDRTERSGIRADDRATLRWYGAAHYQIEHQGLRLLIDPLYTRLPGDKPHLPVTRDELSGVDCLLVTHGHLDHSWDVPYLAARHRPEIHAPAALLEDIRQLDRAEGGADGRARYHALEETKGQPFQVGAVRVTPYQIGAEQIDYWFMRAMLVRPIRHRAPGSVPTGIRWLRHHLKGNCFAFHLHFSAEGRRLLFFGNLTAQVDELNDVDRVDVLALPYCPANRDWIRDTGFLIDRFRPAVTLVHHHDNFMHPYTLSRYIDLGEYRRAVMSARPSTRFFVSRFYKDVSLAEILEAL